jgi:surfactin synthase thioesterase subunit
MEALVEALACTAEPLLDRPFILFGHSMGALIGFELAHEMRRRYRVEPAVLVVSGQGAPDVSSRMHLSALGDEALVAALDRLGGTPPEILADPELLSLLLPAVRADLCVCERYVYRPRPPLTRPVHAFLGRDDPLVASSEASRWREYTSGEFCFEEVAGGHFYFREAPDQLLAPIGNLCRRVVAKGGAL